MVLVSVLEAKKLTQYTFSILIFLTLIVNLGESLLDLLILIINLLLVFWQSLPDPFHLFIETYF